MKKYLIVTGDTNDGDYVTEQTKVTDKELEKLKPIIAAIKKCKESRNWGTGENCDGDEHPNEVYKGVLTEDQIEYFSDNFVPSGEYGIHTIDSIELLEVVKETKLL